jgi:hypothetical protein
VADKTVRDIFHKLTMTCFQCAEWGEAVPCENENLWKKWGSESNGYENMMYHAFKDKHGVHYDYEFEQHVLDTFHHEDFSRVEYFTILPTNKLETIAPYIKISNAKESKTIKLSILDGP